jgi:hypothetical protein
VVEVAGARWNVESRSGDSGPVERLCPVAIQPEVERELTEERSKKSGHLYCW